MAIQQQKQRQQQQERFEQPLSVSLLGTSRINKIHPTVVPPQILRQQINNISAANSLLGNPDNPWKCSSSASSSSSLILSNNPSSSPSASSLLPSSSSTCPIISVERRTNWGSIYLSTLVTFCCQVQFSLFLNSQFAFMKTLDPSTTESFFGFVVGGFSLVQIVVTPLMGIWAQRIEQVRLPLLVCNAFMLIGNFIYYFVDLFPIGWVKYVFLVARLVSGIGPAQNSLLLSYATSASVDKDRPNATAFITGGIAIGITMGPAFQWLFTFIDYPGIHLFGRLYLGMFTAPALFAVTMNVVLHFMLQFCFHESYVGILSQKNGEKGKGNKTEMKAVPSEISMQQLQEKLPPYDRVALAVCCCMRFTQYLTFTNLETIGTSFSMMMFRWTSTDVVTYESLAHMARGGITLLVYMAYIIFNLGKRVNERMVCLSALLLLLSFHLVTFSWPFYTDDVTKYDSTAANTSSSPQLGCDRHTLEWCDGLKSVQVWVYYLSVVFLIGLAFPNINVTMNTLFSRMIGPRLQSREQGMLELFGGFGRLLGPSAFGFLYTKYGPRPIWIVESAEIALMMVCWLVCWKRLIPLRIPKEIDGPRVERKMEQIARQSFAGNLPR